MVLTLNHEQLNHTMENQTVIETRIDISEEICDGYRRQVWKQLNDYIAIIGLKNYMRIRLRIGIKGRTN